MPVRRLLSVALVGSLIAAAGVAVGPAGAHRHADLFWRAAHIQGIDAEHFATLTEMAHSADAVVLGRLTSVRLGRVFGEPDERLPHPADAQVFEAAVGFDVEEVLAGTLDPSAWTFEVHIPEASHVEVLAGLLSDDRSVLFLRSKSEEARREGAEASTIERNVGFYRLVTDQAVVVEVDGLAIPAKGEPEEALQEIASKPFAEFVSQLRSLGAAN